MVRLTRQWKRKKDSSDRVSSRSTPNTHGAITLVMYTWSHPSQVLSYNRTEKVSKGAFGCLDKPPEEIEMLRHTLIWQAQCELIHAHFKHLFPCSLSQESSVVNKRHRWPLSRVLIKWNVKKCFSSHTRNIFGAFAMEFTPDYQRLFGLMMHIQISYSADCFIIPQQFNNL